MPTFIIQFKRDVVYKNCVRPYIFESYELAIYVGCILIDFDLGLVMWVFDRYNQVEIKRE